MRSWFAGVVLFSVAAAVNARLTVAVFPLVTEDTMNAELNAWAACLPAEALGRVGRHLAAVQVYDAAFLFGADSSAWRMQSDSLLEIHRQRWKWDVVVGGSFRTVSDTFVFSVRAVRSAESGLAGFTVAVQGVSVLDAMQRLVSALLERLGEPELAATAASLVNNATGSEIAYRTYAAGYNFEIQQRYWAAVSAYQQAIDLDPELATAALRMAGLYARAGDGADAVRWGEYAARRAPNDPVIQAGAISILADRLSPEKTGKRVAGREAMLQTTADGLAALGRYSLARGDYRRAIAYLTQAVAFGPAHLEADFDLGRAALAAGEFGMAAEVFNRLVTFRPDCPRYYSFLGAAYRSMGRLMESVRALSIAAGIGGEDVTVMVNLASTYVEIGWLEEAERLLVRAREANPLMLEAWVNLAVVYWLLGKRDLARQTLAGVPQRKRTQAVFNNEAVIRLEEGRTRQAMRWLMKARQSGRKNERILANLGSVCEQTGRLREAVKWYDELLALNPQRLDIQQARARLAQRMGDVAAAEQAYRSMVQNSPHNQDAVLGLADALKRQGRSREAVEVLERYLNDYPGDVDVRLKLARVYLDMEWPQVAAHHFETVAREQPGSYEAQVGVGEALFAMLGRKTTVDTSTMIAAFRKAKALAPTEPAPDYFLGRFYADYRRDPVRAREYLNSALEHAKEQRMRKAVKNALAQVTQ